MLEATKPGSVTTGQTADNVPPPAQPTVGVDDYSSISKVAKLERVPLVVGNGKNPPRSSLYIASGTCNGWLTCQSIERDGCFAAGTFTVAAPGTDGIMYVVASLPDTATAKDIQAALAKAQCQCFAGGVCICGSNCQCTTMTGIQGTVRIGDPSPFGPWGPPPFNVPPSPNATQWPYSAPPSWIGGGFAPISYGGTSCASGQCGMGFTGMMGAGCAGGSCGAGGGRGLLGRFR